MLFVLPVYEHSLIISKSTHQALLGPGPAYKPYSNHTSVEIHPVTWVPGPWVVKTKTVLADGQIFMLDGHDTGMMIPHISRIMDNLMLPVTLLTSSCTWPFTTGTRSVGDKCVVGFFPGIAPFIYCDSPEDGGSSTAAEVAALRKQRKMRVYGVKAPLPAPVPSLMMEMSDAATDGAAKRVATRKALFAPVADRLNKLPGATAAGNLLGTLTKVEGKGVIYIPMCKTVLMKMRWTEVLAGWARLFVGNAVGALTSRMFKPLRHPVTVIRGKKSNPKVIPVFSEALTGRLTGREVAKYLGTTLVNKTAVDGVLKSMVLDMKIKAPYGVFKYDIKKGKGSYLYWCKFDGVHPPEEFPLEGLQSRFNAWAGKGLDTKPIDVLTQTPNVAGG